MPTSGECLCCLELIDEPNFRTKIEEGKCITLTSGFQETSLTESVLEMSIAMRQTRLFRLPGQAERNPALYRHIAYMNFTHWVFSHSLRKNLVHVLPSCVVNAIRNKFPDPNNMYTGNKLFN